MGIDISITLPIWPKVKSWHKIFSTPHCWEIMFNQWFPWFLICTRVNIMNVMHELDVRTLGAWNRVHVLTASEKAEACNKQFHSAFVVLGMRRVFLLAPLSDMSAIRVSHKGVLDRPLTIVYNFSNNTPAWVLKESAEFLTPYTDFF